MLGLFLLAGVSSCTRNGGPTPTDLDDLEPTTVSISEISFRMGFVGETRQLGVIVFDQLGQILTGAVTWTSTAPGVASVTAGGVVTAVANGSGAIVATAGTASDTAIVTVEQQADSIVLSSPTVDLSGVGDTVRISATVLDAGGAVVAGASIEWASSDPAVATVSVEGTISAVASGATTVTGTSGPASVEIPVVVIAPASLRQQRVRERRLRHRERRQWHRERRQ
jgi:uncharacterized protein YjdB